MYSKGESILEQEKYLDKVALYQKKSIAYWHERFTHCDQYEIIALSGNNELPKWMNLELKFGVIHLRGNPQS